MRFFGTNLLKGDALASAFIPQCQLVLSGGNLQLNRYRGDAIPIDGVIRNIPSSGPTLAATGLIEPKATTNRVIASSVATLTTPSGTAVPIGSIIGVKGVGSTASDSYNGSRVVTGSSTTTVVFASGSVVTSATAADANGTIYVVYFIYAYWTGSAIALEASLTGHSTDTATGVETKAGDTSRTLVGMAAVVAGPAWSDTAQLRLVRSYYNRQRLATAALASALRSTSATAVTEIHAEFRAEALLWTDETWVSSLSGSVYNSGANACYTAIALDSLESLGGGTVFTCTAANQLGSIAVNAIESGLAEGYHYTSLHGYASAGTANWYFSGIVRAANKGVIM